MPDSLSKNKKLVPISEAASILGVSIDTIRRWDKNGKIKSTRPDGKTRHFSIDDLEKFKFSRKLSISEASKQLNISQSTLRRLEKKGLIKPDRQNNGERFYDRQALEDFLHSNYFMRQKTGREEIVKPLEEPFDRAPLDKPRDKQGKPEEKDEKDQKEKELLDSINFESETQHLENRGNARNEGAQPNPNLKPRLRMPAFIAISTAMFFLLFALGMRNINISAAENLQSLPTPEVLSETEETLPTEEVESEMLLRVKMEDASASASIYQGPTTDSEKIGEARDGDTFEYVYLNSDWYEIRLPYDGTTGFISRGFIVRGETEEAVPTEEEKPEIILTVKMKNASASANIRRSPTINSEKIGKARGGDTFRYVSFDSDWYEIRLIDGTTGFISGEFIVREETDK